MGNGIAHVFARAGMPVTLVDVSSDALQRARATIEKNLARQVQKGTMDAAARDAVLERMQLVEVIRGLATSDDTTRHVIELAKRLGKTPVEVNDSPGFVSNRVLIPMINEAAYCVMEGVGTPEAIDTVMKLGMNHPMGPLALADLIGLDTCVSILEVLQSGLGDPKYRACPLLKKYVAAGWLGRKSGRGFYTY